VIYFSFNLKKKNCMLRLLKYQAKCDLVTFIIERSKPTFSFQYLEKDLRMDGISFYNFEVSYSI